MQRELNEKARSLFSMCWYSISLSVSKGFCSSLLISLLRVERIQLAFNKKGMGTWPLPLYTVGIELLQGLGYFMVKLV